MKASFYYLYTLWKVNIFLCETQNGMKNPRQDNFQGFSKNPKSEVVIYVAYGTEFVSSMASVFFYLACQFVLCIYLLTYFTY